MGVREGDGRGVGGRETVVGGQGQGVGGGGRGGWVEWGGW